MEASEHSEVWRRAASEIFNVMHDTDDAPEEMDKLTFTALGAVVCLAKAVANAYDKKASEQ